ncbi:MAG: hypothetical protein JNK22_07845, partial [Rhodocyclaceae bacterium]|nr:hypothetical protein [Rhodocyclaceae bacterium]
MLPEKTAATHSQRWLFAAFALSGFSGLIYESIWSHYLKLLLGHAAYAQTLVLVIFMGGMAIGAAWASRLTSRRRNLLRLYAAVEAAIGLLGLVFDPLFRHWLEFSLSTVIPSIGFPQGVEAYKWASSGLLILPQSIMLGMTFPLMTGGVIRRFPQATGGSIAMLYFTNSIGGALGALCSAFWLLGAVGLSGTLVVAALVNLALAAVVWFLGAEEERPLATPVAAGQGDPDLPGRFLVAAFVTGAASFIYEVVWIRMLALVLGSSTQAFELMLSAFITGLALGGLWIRNRIDRIADPVRFSGYVQLAMGGLALATLVFYNGTFDLMAYALRAINRTDEAYPLFNLFSHAIAFAVMLPATFMAGMTLPLFTHVLIRQGHGEASVGRIYASNTLGAIVGVAFAVHVGLPGAGIKLALSTGALADMFLGAYLLRFCASRWHRAEALAASLVAAVAVAAATTLARLDPLRMASGVFRLGDHQLLAGHELLFYQDGSTATITVTRAPDGGVMIATNGKPDATISLDPARPPSNDEITMVMAGSLPLLLKPDARKVANIGLGSGLTTHTVLTHSGVERVDTVEIEPAMVAGATAFRARVPAAFADPRSHMQIEDAKTYFARHGVRYDVIISEPSNPWVSGVASLFTTEFYRDVRRHLKDDGLLVQWFHLYEVDDRLVSTVILALAENFDDFAIYLTDTTNMLIVAPRNGKLPPLQAPSPTQRAFIEGMAR